MPPTLEEVRERLKQGIDPDPKVSVTHVRRVTTDNCPFCNHPKDQHQSNNITSAPTCHETRENGTHCACTPSRRACLNCKHTAARHIKIDDCEFGACTEKDCLPIPIPCPCPNFQPSLPEPVVIMVDDPSGPPNPPCVTCNHPAADHRLRHDGTRGTCMTCNGLYGREKSICRLYKPVTCECGHEESDHRARKELPMRQLACVRCLCPMFIAFPGLAAEDPLCDCGHSATRHNDAGPHCLEEDCPCLLDRAEVVLNAMVRSHA